MDAQLTIDAMRDAARALKADDVRDTIRAVQAAQDALDATKASLLAELEASRDFELDGASTLNAWVRNQLRMNAGQATALIKNVAALRDLPLVADAAMAGQISAAHVRVFVYGLQHIGLDPMREFEGVFVDVARDCEPGELFEPSSTSRTRSTPKTSTPPGNEAWTKRTSRSTPSPTAGM